QCAQPTHPVHERRPERIQPLLPERTHPGRGLQAQIEVHSLGRVLTDHQPLQPAIAAVEDVGPHHPHRQRERKDRGRRDDQPSAHYALYRTSATVMLSTPPFALASSTISWQAFCRSGSLATISAMRSSVTMPVKPSQQTRHT